MNCIENHPEYFKSSIPKRLYWLTDSQNVASWLKKGSKKPYIQKDIVKLLLQLMNLNLVIEPVHVPRDHTAIALADEAGKDGNTDGWSIDDQSFRTLEFMSGIKFTCDVFAHSSNRRCEKFYSKYPSLGTAGINTYKG